MSEWGRHTYGDPCRGCGYRWSLGHDQLVDIVRSTPGAYVTLLGGHDGSERIESLSWSASSYVCHVVDNLRIWAERLMGATTSPVFFDPYDADLLARARGYSAVPLQGALWSLGRAAGDWVVAVGAASHSGASLVHRDRGPQSLLDTMRNNAHDAFHHRWDLARIVGSQVSPPILS